MFFNVPQIQYKNPWVQIMMFKNMTPTPFLRFYLGECRGRGPWLGLGAVWAASERLLLPTAAAGD